MDAQEIVILVILCLILFVCCVGWTLCFLARCDPENSEEEKLIAAAA